ncbi:MATE family efflux transporter [Bradyrhizobium sp. SZCCHNR2035]|uniref:MATE family efflux transporter n=1 Tax=Bradyrhizobium sp. SZCCHNR2035 TaxID=3057386 RepID=UPI002916E749|nr:MATE family efflux transporter [Bradyrhizobium sp. SZCCHNR2035]
MNGPILTTMLWLALPTMAAMLVQTFVGIAQIYFISNLGSQAIAGTTLAFPLLMLMQAVSGSGIGGGVASAIGRAYGAGRRGEVDALLLNAVLIALLCGLLWSAVEAVGARFLYGHLGGSGGVLDDAVTYSHAVFVGSILFWLVNILSAALRGVGDTLFPAIVSFGSVSTLLLSPIMIFGWGAVPAFGLAGAGLAWNIYNVASCIALWFYIQRESSPLRLSWRRDWIQWALLRKILEVGFLSSISTVQSTFTIVLVTAAVATFGGNAIAGFGVASRVEYVVLSLMFGLGTAVLAMVSMNIGANQVLRARKIAIAGAAMAVVIAGAIGLISATLSTQWLAAFSGDEPVIEAGSLYLKYVGPSYGLYGLGLVLYFASQGAGRVFLPVLAGTARLILAGGAGLVVVELGGNSATLFAIFAIAFVTYGLLNLLSFYVADWRLQVGS